jgi:hypothetical protein
VREGREEGRDSERGREEREGYRRERGIEERERGEREGEEKG